MVNQWAGLAWFPSLPALLLASPSPFLFVSPHEALLFPGRPVGQCSHLAPCWGGRCWRHSLSAFPGSAVFLSVVRVEGVGLAEVGKAKEWGRDTAQRRGGSV